MTYIYYPSTYGKGFSGGNYRGMGLLVGGVMAFGSKNPFQNAEALPVSGSSAPPAILAKIAAAEATGKPVSVSSKEGDSWKDYLNTAADVGTLALGAANLPLGIAAYATKRALTSEPAKRFYRNTGSFFRNMWRGLKSGYADFKAGRGYCGGARFRKGSPEAKRYMARLRAMRKKGRGLRALGYSGGGSRLRKGSPEAKRYMAKLRAMRRKKKGKGLRALGYGGFYATTPEASMHARNMQQMKQRMFAIKNGLYNGKVGYGYYGGRYLKGSPQAIKAMENLRKRRRNQAIFVKGSKAAKDYMKSLRKMRKNKSKGKGLLALGYY